MKPDCLEAVRRIVGGKLKLALPVTIINVFRFSAAICFATFILVTNRYQLFVLS